MNTAKIEFTGTIEELVALLEQHKIVGTFSAKIKVEVGITAEVRMIEELKQAGSAILAIKALRGRTGMTLKDAKEYVVKHCREAYPNLY